MTLSTLVVVVLILLLLGGGGFGLSRGSFGTGYGRYGGPSIIVVLVIVLLVMWLAGRG